MSWGGLQTPWTAHTMAALAHHRRSHGCSVEKRAGQGLSGHRLPTLTPPSLRHGAGVQSGLSIICFLSSEQSEEEGEKRKMKKRKKAPEGPGEGPSSDEGSDSSSSSSESEMSSETEEEQVEPASWRKKTVRALGREGVGHPEHRCLLPNPQQAWALPSPPTATPHFLSQPPRGRSGPAAKEVSLLDLEDCESAA